jgi:hypothetical protein
VEAVVPINIINIIIQQELINIHRTSFDPNLVVLPPMSLLTTSLKMLVEAFVLAAYFMIF